MSEGQYACENQQYQNQSGAAKLLGWTEIECTAIGMNTVQAELAEIDENIVCTRLNR